MTLENIIENIKLLTVKVNTDKESGTGVLFLQDTKAYVLTVYHCIYGKGAEAHNVENENISFKFDFKICEDIINPLYFRGCNENIVLLEVDINKLKIDFIPKLLLLDRAYYDENYHLRGYPKVLKHDHPFEAKCRDKDLDEVTFKIEVDGLTNDTSGDDANELIAGLSGSGVFFSEYNQLYLVGLVNALATENGTFNAIHCSKLIDLTDVVKLSKRLVFEDYAQTLEITDTKNLRYKNQLIKAYNSESKNEIISVEDIDKRYMIHFEDAEKSFHEIEILRRFSRDIFVEDEYEKFQKNIYTAIRSTLLFVEHKNDFQKVITVEDKSINVNTEFYPLENKKCEMTEKMGVCHHLVEDEIISWVDDE